MSGTPDNSRGIWVWNGVPQRRLPIILPLFVQRTSIVDLREKEREFSRGKCEINAEIEEPKKISY